MPVVLQRKGAGEAVVKLRALAPFGIQPRPRRLPGGELARSYQREDFAEAWARYLPAETM